MRKRNATREASDTVQLRVALPFIHRGARVFAGDIIECTADEAEGALYHGWATRLINGGDDAAGRHARRDMRAKP
jgi:hypothetical protein